MQSLRKISTPINYFKKGLANVAETQHGLWAMLADPFTTHLSAGAGFDFLVIDGEHAPGNDVREIILQIMAVDAANYRSGYKTSAVVRVPWNDHVVIKRVLDGGAQTILVPQVNSAKEAIEAVNAVRYSRGGRDTVTRGVALAHPANFYGRCKNYLDEANEQICLIVQIETRQAAYKIYDIASVRGVDALFIGPSDLAADCGHLGDSAHEEVQKQIGYACLTVKQLGMPIGILAPVEADARRYAEMGFSFVALGSDLGILRAGVDALGGRFTEVGQ